jgi:hypothetical protein
MYTLGGGNAKGEYNKNILVYETSTKLWFIYLFILLLYFACL